MKRFTNKILLPALLLCAVSAAAQKPAAPKAQKDYVACFAAWDANMQTLQTDFVQTTEYDGVLISRSAGRIYYEKNGPKLRLDNVDASKTVTQTALTDKKQIFILDEKGKEISTLSWNDWLSGQPNQALFDFGNYAALLARHKAEEFEKTGDEVILRLKPKDSAQSYALYVAVGEKDCFPRHITVRSELMSTTAELTDKKLNAALKKDIFKGLKK